MALANNAESFKRQTFKGVFLAKKLLKDWIDGDSITLRYMSQVTYGNPTNFAEIRRGFP